MFRSLQGPLLWLGLLAFGPGCSAGAKMSPPRSPDYQPSRGAMNEMSANAPASASKESDGDEGGGSVAPAEPTAPPPSAPGGVQMGPVPRPEPAPRAVLAQASTEPGKGRPDAPRGDLRDAGSVREQRAPVLIYTATFSMAVFEVKTSLDDAERLAREAGGFVTKRTDRLITVRVPAARFYDTVARLEKLGEMLQRDVVAQDVTEEFLDTEIRLRNARAVRDRLEQLLAKASSVQDSLLIERELNRVAAEIDRMEGRLKFLRDRAAFSTLTLSFEPRRTTAPTPSVHLPFPWLRSSSLSRLLSL